MMRLFFGLITVVVVCLGICVEGSFPADNSTNDVGEGRYLLYPSNTALQLSICTSSGTPFFRPKKKYPFRRLGVNIGFQVNYPLPYRLSDFYKFPTWARAFTDIVKGRVFPTEVVTARSTRRRRSNREISAGDIYTTLEEILQFHGYDEDCVVKSVCELAHSPFHSIEDDVMAEILHFVLTPSEHQAFDTHERKLQIKYEVAERHGRNGADCHQIYSKCNKSFLSDISGYVDDPSSNFIK